jgi:hypothetical protein
MSACADDDRPDPSIGLRDSEREIEPAQVGARAIGDLLDLRGALRRRAVPHVVVVVRAAGQVDRHEQRAALQEDDVLHELRVRAMRAIEEARPRRL